MKNWITERIEWMDLNIPGNCSSIFSKIPEFSENLFVHVFLIHQRVNLI